MYIFNKKKVSRWNQEYAAPGFKANSHVQCGNWNGYAHSVA